MLVSKCNSLNEYDLCRLYKALSPFACGVMDGLGLMVEI
jgi:hypothetical protein